MQVKTCAEDSGPMDALRSVADHLAGENVLVMSSDIVTDLPLKLSISHNPHVHP